MGEARRRNTLTPGEKYGRLTIIRKVEVKSRKKYTQYEVKCDCGNISIKEGTYVRSGATKSCGCLQDDCRRNAQRKMARVNSLHGDEAGFRRLKYTYIHRARRKGLEFTLTDDQLKIIFKQECRYCGAPPSSKQLTQRKNGRELGAYLYNGIDRVNSGQGYIPENVVPCCPDCNYSKNDRSVSDFIAWVEKVYLVNCRNPN